MHGTCVKICQYYFVLIHVSRIGRCVLFRLKISPQKFLYDLLDSLSAYPHVSTYKGEELK